MPVCPVCGSTKWTKRYRIGRWDIEECAVCAFARIDPMPRQETRAEYYSKEKVVTRNTGRKSPSHRFSNILKNLFSGVTKRNKSGIFYKKFLRYLPANSGILDVGCGDGSFLKLAKDNFNCAGIEISEYLASLARNEGSIKVIAGDFLNADFADNKYDGISLISILEHLDDPARAIKKCFELLNRSGVLLMKTVNYGCLNRRIRKKNWTGFRPPDHVVYFTPANLRMFLEKTGFAKIKISSWPFNDNMYCEAWK